MHKPAKRISIVWLPLLAMCGNALAAAPITAAQWQQLTSDPAFAYKNDKESFTPPHKMEDGYLQRLLSSVFDFFGNGAGRAVLWCIVAGIVVFIVYKLLFSQDSILFGKSSKPMKEQQAAVEEEDIATTNWDALLQKAMQGNDHRLAIRYSYMQLLQLLQKKGLISFGSDKTNFDYYNELANSEYKQPFKQLSRQYEYTWYGQYALSPQQYDNYSVLFNNLKKQLAA